MNDFKILSNKYGYILIFVLINLHFLSCNSSHVLKITDNNLSESIVKYAGDKYVHAMTLKVKAKMTKPFKLRLNGDGNHLREFDFPEGLIDKEQTFDWYTRYCSIEYLSDPSILGRGEIEIIFHY